MKLFILLMVGLISFGSIASEGDSTQYEGSEYVDTSLQPSFELPPWAEQVEAPPGHHPPDYYEDENGNISYTEPGSEESAETAQ